MTGMSDHAFGCSCRHHVGRAWDRSEHWSTADVLYLEASFGRIGDETIARKVGRSVVGVRLKAKRLGLRKRDAGNTAREVARIFGVDPTTVVDRWIAMGLLRARRDLVARDPWVSLPEAHRLTGRNTHAIATAIRYGILRGRRRGTRALAHWYIPATEVAKIPPLTTADAIDESWFRRQNVLAMRRRRRTAARAAA